MAQNFILFCFVIKFYLKLIYNNIILIIMKLIMHQFKRYLKKLVRYC